MVLQVQQHDDSWILERSNSSGHLVWCKEKAKIRFRYEVEVREFQKDPNEHHFDEDYFETNKISSGLVVCITCMAALAATFFLPWYLVGSG